MVCFSPINIIDTRPERSKNYNTVPCGRCYACRMNNRIEWTYRLYQELLGSTSAYFITLTYNDENIPEIVDKNTGEVLRVLRKSDLQSYIKRLRKKGKLRYYAVGEYGEQSKRPHYHMLLFNYNSETPVKDIEEKWPHGHVHIGNVEQASIHYCTKDMMKQKKENHVGGVYGFRTMSTKPAIGYRDMYYLGNNQRNKDFTTYFNGYKIALPRYYRDRLFTDYEKKKHAKEMLQQSDERWLKFIRECKKKGIQKPFSLILKEFKAAENREAAARKIVNNNKIKL